MTNSNGGWRGRNEDVNERYRGRVMSPEDTRKEMDYIFPGGLKFPRIGRLGNGLTDYFANIGNYKLPAGSPGSGETNPTGDTTAAAEPPMPPWLSALTSGQQKRYPGAQLAGTPPIPSAQYVRNASESQLAGLQGVVQKAGGYIPDWLALIQYLSPRGAAFSTPTRNVFAKY